jgi:type I restriction enzyme S subunit
VLHQPKVDPDYLYYVLSSDLVFTQFDRLANGSTVRNLNIGLAKSVEIPFPPLPEQQRIVGILDKAFADIAVAEANVEKNLQNVRALFESHLQSVLTPCGKGWVKKRLGDVAESISTGPFGTMLHKSDYVTDGIPLVNPMNIVDSRIVPSSKMMVNEETRERLRVYALKVGDVVIARRGELGRCALVTEREEGWLCGTGSFFVRLSDCMEGKFFVALFGSQQFRARLEGSAVGTTMSNLNHGILNDLLVPVPPIAVQRNEMAKADELLSETRRLAHLYERKLAALQALKKSLLHQAFTGNL